jgi:hypothetical protein
MTTCAFNPAAVNPGRSNATTTLTVATTGRSAALRGISKFWLATWMGLSSLGLLVVVIGRRRYSNTTGRFLALIMFMLLTLTLLNCGSRNNEFASGDTPAGNYAVTVTATSAGVSHAASFGLTVN